MESNYTWQLKELQSVKAWYNFYECRGISQINPPGVEPTTRRYPMFSMVAKMSAD